MKSEPIAPHFGLLLLRCVLGAVFFFHGCQKLFGVFGGDGLDGTARFMSSLGLPLPMASAVLVACAEFFGSIALFTGLYMQLAITPLAFAMLVATFTAHYRSFAVERNGMEFTLVLAGACTMLVLTGPGKYAWNAGSKGKG